MIKMIDGKRHYFDKNGREIKEGSKVKFCGRVEEIYLTQDDELGTDATNRAWIETGRAFPCEYGIYPLTKEDTEEMEVIC